MAETSSQLWEVLVPVADNDGNEFPIEHHHEWDEAVRETTGGLTIMRTAKGQWQDEGGRLYSERMIPVRVACDEEKIRDIMEVTMRHYGQKAVMAYQISERALILNAEE